MSSLHAPSFAPLSGVTAPVVLPPPLAAMVFNPLGQRLRIRQRLSMQVYIADCVSDASSVASSTPTKQLVVKLERLHQPDVAHGTSNTVNTELQTARQLLAWGGHRHVVRFVETYAAHNMALLVMEHCEDGDLFSHLFRTPNHRLSEREALAKLHQIASGVQFLHQHNIAHRDLALENVLLKDGICKVCDFGLSTRADLLVHDVVGKTLYAAPEVVQGEWYDPVRADLWSLGVVLFMLLTGSPLVQFASPSCPEFRAFRAVGVRGVLCAWGLQSQFTAATVELLSELLEVNPVKRMPSATQLLSHTAFV